MQLVAGTLLRNFVNAKVMTLHNVLDAMREQRMPCPSVLLIPNFFDHQDASVMDWQASLLLDCLMSRKIQGQQTILHVSDMVLFRETFGNNFHKFLAMNFKII